MIQHHCHRTQTLILSALCTLLSAFSTSCSSEQDTLPNIVTEMADIHTDETGKTKTLELDNGQIYDIANPSTGLKEEQTYRALVNFVHDESTATLYSSQGAYVLKDSTETPKTDPVKVISIWRTSRYINLHLAPLTQGGTQHWGFLTDSVVDGHQYLHLHHNQNGDPTSYTTDVYASMPIEGNVPITLRIKTFDGEKTFEL